MQIVSTRKGKEKVEEVDVSSLTTGLGGITRSGRCYTPEELELRRKEAAREEAPRKRVTEEEAEELWLGVKCHSNPELAGSPRNALRRSS